VKALVIDAGNSRITVRGLDGEDQFPRLPGADGPPLRALTELGDQPTPRTEEDLADLAAWFGALAASVDAAPVVLASVVPDVTGTVRSVFSGALVVDHTAALPFTCAVAEPASVGADRFCNVTAAVAAGLASALVIDAGTATTFDVLVDGVHLGGIIAPGMALAAEALGRGAAQLPVGEFAAAPLMAADSTSMAMRAGAWHAGRGGVAAVAGGLLATHGPLTVVVTGGLGVHLRDLGHHDADWTLRGAAWLALRAPAGC